MKKASVLVVAVVLAIAGVVFFKMNHEKAGDGNVPAFSSSQETASSALKSAPGAVTPSPHPSYSPTAEDQAKVQTLNQILISKNDNDPRLDQDFNHLTPAAKELFMEKYRQLAPEKLNQRGTIVFLLNRNLSSPDDFNFLKEVLNEPACLSLANCSKDPGPASSEDLHHDLGSGITLIYPKLVSLMGLDNYLKQPVTDPALVQQAVQALEQSENSSNPRISQKATQILREYSARKSGS